MRIGMLTTSYPRHEGDVAGAFVRSMAREFVSLGHSIEVLAPRPRVPTDGCLDPGIDVRWINYAPGLLRKTFYGAGVPDNLRDPRAWPGLATFPAALYREARLRADRWDAFVSHWALPNAVVAGVLRGRRPHLAVLHSADVHLVRKLPLRARVAERIGSSASELLFASGAHRKTFLDLLPSLSRARLAGRCHASAMGIEPLLQTRNKRTLRKELGLSGFSVLSLGRLVPIKGIDRAIAAVAPLPDVELIIAGDGPSRSRLERGARARFVGVVSGVRKAEFLRAADAFVVPSVELPSGRTEGTPIAALEAAQAGLPIIASRTAGLEEVLVHERSALLVPPGDAVALRAAIERLRDDAALRRRLGRAAKTVAKRYLWSELGPRFEGLLQG